MASDEAQDASGKQAEPHPEDREAHQLQVITMIHRQERIALFGIPFYRYIDVEDSEQVLRAIRMNPVGHAHNAHHPHAWRLGWRRPR